MATAQVEAGDLHFTGIRNIPCAAVAIHLWANGDARGGVAAFTRERGRARGDAFAWALSPRAMPPTFFCVFYLLIHEQ